MLISTWNVQSENISVSSQTCHPWPVHLSARLKIARSFLSFLVKLEARGSASSPELLPCLQRKECWGRKVHKTYLWGRCEFCLLQAKEKTVFQRIMDFRSSNLEKEIIDCYEIVHLPLLFCSGGPSAVCWGGPHRNCLTMGLDPITKQGFIIKRHNTNRSLSSSIKWSSTKVRGFL